MTEKIKLCAVTTVPFTIQVFLLDQLAYLASQGFEVTVVCDDDPDFKMEWPPELEYFPVTMKRDMDFRGTVKAFFQILKCFKARRFDMVQYTTPKASLLSAVASCLAGVPVRVYCQWGMRYVGMKGFRKWAFKQIEKLTCRCSTDIVPDSFGNLACAIDEGVFPADKGSVVARGSANGVNLARFSVEHRNEWREKIRFNLGIAEETFVFGYVGRITRDKGIAELVEAFYALKKEESNLALVLVGPRDENHALDERIICLLDNDPDIYELGYQKDPNEYMSAFDLMVLPSYREGFGLAAIEGQALGIPVVTTDIPGPREAVLDGQTGLLVPPGQIAPLKKAMAELYADAEQRQIMGKQAVKFVQANFEQGSFWQKVLEHRLDLLRKHGVG